MARKNRDIAKTCSRFLNALRRIHDGIEQQQRRVLAAADNAPKLLADSEFAVTDLTGVPGNDLDYYAYELARLHDLARSVHKIFGDAGVATAIAEFEKAVPRLREARDPLTHINDNDELDDIAWLSAIYRLKTDGSGSPELILDPRYGHHDAALSLVQTLTAFLRAELKAAP